MSKLSIEESVSTVNRAVAVNFGSDGERATIDTVCAFGEIKNRITL